MTHRSAFCLLLASIAPTAFAQTLDTLEFLSPPQRTVISAPLAELQAEGPCTIVLDLSIDRSGHVFHAVANAMLSDCADLALMGRAVRLMKTWSFAPAPDAPEVHKARMTWSVGMHPFDDDNVAVPPAEPMMEEASPVIQEDPHADFADFIVDVPPSFPGGTSAVNAYLRRTLRYPADALEAEQEGKVFASFIINTDGSLEDIKVMRGLSPALDQEAVRAVKSMPNWIPGQQNGRPVRVRQTIPIVFRIE